MAQQDAYPVTLRGELTDPPNSGLWLIKWLLAIPHCIILAFLWIGFIGAGVIALFAIVFTIIFTVIPQSIGSLTSIYPVVQYRYTAVPLRILGTLWRQQLRALRRSSASRRRWSTATCAAMRRCASPKSARRRSRTPSNVWAAYDSIARPGT